MPPLWSVCNLCFLSKFHPPSRQPVVLGHPVLKVIGRHEFCERVDSSPHSSKDPGRSDPLSVNILAEIRYDNSMPGDSRWWGMGNYADVLE